MPSKRVKIEIDQGIFSFGTPFEIGPRLQSSTRYINKYIPQKANAAVDMVGQSWAPFELGLAQELAITDCSLITSVERFENSELSGDPGYLFGGSDLLTRNAVWDETGAKVFNDAGSGPGRVVTSIVHWHSLATPTTYVTGPSMLAMKKTVDRTTFTTYAPVGFTGNADRLLVYQSRLWLSQSNKLYYTDVFDPNTVRQYGFVNPFVVPMPITVIERIGVSDFDPGAQSHLFIGGNTQIWILDGSPGQGNEVLRRLTTQYGVNDEKHVTASSLGTFFFSKFDRMIYLVLAGAVAEPQPIALPIRNLLSSGDVTISWRKPYLLVLISKTDGCYYLYFDVSQPESPRWWGGYKTAGQSNLTFAGISSRYPSHDYLWAAYQGGTFAGSLHKILDPTATDGVRTQAFMTGFIHEPGYEVVLRKMHATIRRGPVAKQFTFSSFDEDDQTQVYALTIPVSSATQKLDKITVPILSPNGTRGDGIYVQVVCKEKEHASDLGLRAIESWEVEYDIIPRMKV